MYLLTDSNSGGVYAVFNKDNVKTVHLFEEEDDVLRYQTLLEADNPDSKLDILEMDPAIVEVNCNNRGYLYTVITKDDLVIPPKTE